MDIGIEIDRRIALLRECEKDVKKAESIKMNRQEKEDFGRKRLPSGVPKENLEVVKEAA